MITDIKINGKEIDDRIQICESSLCVTERPDLHFYEIYVDIPKGEPIKGRFSLGRLHKGIIEWKEDGKVIKGRAYISYDSSQWIFDNDDGSKHMCKEFCLKEIE